MGIESPRGRNKLAAPARPALSPERSESLIDADLSNYFGTIPHRELMKMVARRVSDGSVLRLIKSWLRAPVVEEDKDGTKRVIPNRCGTPQGGVISPLLANVFLNPLDHGVNQKCMGKARMVRYADDFVIMCRVGQAQEIRERTRKWLTAKGLKFNEGKTRLVDIRQEGINFLGFNLTWRKSLKHHGICMWNPVRKAAKLCAWDTWAKSSTTGRYGNPSAKWSRKPIRCC